MKIHCIRHEPFEGLAYIEDWIREMNFPLSYTHTFRNEEFPEINSFDLLIVMGGTVSVYEEDKFTWLRKEKQCIRESIKAGKSILGICLGAQLVANVLHAKVYLGAKSEIGWFPLKFDIEARRLLPFLPKEETVFHWHGDTFDIPHGAVNIGSSDTTPHQGFIYNNKIIALQFHCEMTPTSLENIVQGTSSELSITGPSVQSKNEIMANNMRCSGNNRIIKHILEYLKTVSSEK